jgi:NDP-sugar pyrophosphorylase family protein
MKAMILAAGKGTRLGRITEKIPKVLIDINGKSILQIAVEKCSEYGFDDIIINVHHFADIVKEEAERLKKSGYKITISDESKTLLETGGGLFQARDFFDKSPFLLYNADIVTDLNLSALYHFHKEKKGLATLAVRNRPGKRHFLVNSEGLLSGWCNKATGERILTAEHDRGLSEISFSGMHIIEPEIFGYMKEGIYTMTSLYLNLAGSHRIFTYRCNDGLISELLRIWKTQGSF